MPYDPAHPRATQRPLRYATLAPSSHNTQCWKFRLEDQAITILPDLSRRCPVVDPDDHHLYVSLGCAAENLIQAAPAKGLSAQCHFVASGERSVRIEFQPTEPRITPLFEAIPHCQCTRAKYDGTPLTPEELHQLEMAGTVDGVQMLMLTDVTHGDGNCAGLCGAGQHRPVQQPRFYGGAAILDPL